MITIEDELALIRKNRSPEPAPAPAQPDPMSQLSQTWRAAITPAADDPQTARSQVQPPAPEIGGGDAAMGLPPRETGLAPLPDDDADTWEVMGAAWRAETIRTDAWNYTERLRRDLIEDMWAALPEDGRQRVLAVKWDQANNWMQFEHVVADELARLAQSGPEAAADLAGLPLSREAFEGTILNRRRSELDEAQAVLDQPGGAVAEFLGAGARAMTDATSLMLLPFGVSGSAWRVIAGEAVLGAVGEAAVLPREYQVARELGEPEPDALARIATGAVLGGGLAGAITGGARIVQHIRTRRAALRAATPEDVNALDAEMAVDAEEARQRGDETVAEVIKRTTPPAPAPGTLGDILAGTGASFDEQAVLARIIGVESGGRANAQAATSSARGLGQFIESTWMAMVETHRPDLLQGRTRNEVLNLRDDPKLNAEMTLLFMRDNRARLQAAGVPSGPGETYLAHFMGSGGAIRALKAPLETPISQIMDAKAVAANRGIRHKGKSFADFTVYDLRMWAAAKMESGGARLNLDAPAYAPTSRGYTGTGQVRISDDLTIDVEYVVVDAGSLTRASGDLQPRDRSGIASDAWIAETAARLDPAQLMPSPNAATGAPIIGPDGIIESGNGRFGAIVRAYEYHPDRASAYRSAIEAHTGQPIPEGIQRPVLVAQRKTDLDAGQRKRMVVDAQDSGVALLSPTELAMAQRRALSADVLAKYRSGLSLDHDDNLPFVKAALALLSKSYRTAMFAKGGALNAYGKRTLREMLFARAWDAEDIVDLFTGADPGELRGLFDALSDSAESWANLKADIEAGLVRPEMDISGHILDAMRVIAAARKTAAKDKATLAAVMDELLNSPDMLGGAVAPLTAALIRKFWRNGRAAPSGEVTDFLVRYATEARKVGGDSGMFGAPGPRDVLRALDPETFGDLPEDFGPVRGWSRPGTDDPRPAPDLPPAGNTAFDAGATGPDAEAISSEIAGELTGPFGPILEDLAGQPEAAIERLMRDQTGEVPAAMTIEGLGPVRFVWGSRTLGLRHILEKHGEAVLRDLPRAMREGRLGPEYNGRRAIETGDMPPRRTVIRLDWDGDGKAWVLTSHDVVQGTDAQPGRTSNVPTEPAPPSVPGATAQSEGIAPWHDAQDPIRREMSEIEAVRDEARLFQDAEIELGDGTKVRVSDLLDDLDDDAGADAVVQACAIGGDA